MVYFIDFMTLWRVIFPNAFALGVVPDSRRHPQSQSAAALLPMQNQLASGDFCQSGTPAPAQGHLWHPTGWQIGFPIQSCYV